VKDKIDRIKERKNREAIALRVNLRKRKIFQKKNKEKNDTK
tara:strand:+ start:257 stop:379 length:123 start_codon:yes stop_codon:yes gene_type:complete